MEMGEGANVASTKTGPDKYLKAKVTAVSFEKSYKACRSKSVITAPHWPADQDGYNQSKKAVVYQLGKDKHHTAKIKIEIDSKGLSGNGKLTGTLGDLVFEGEVSLAKSMHEVTVTLKKNTESLQWLRGNMFWILEGGGFTTMAGVTPVELFFVFDDPAKMKFFKSKGVWIEALRFIFKEGKLGETQKINDALSKVTKGCFELKANQYEIGSGAANFGGANNIFELTDYMKATPRKPQGEDYVNCYDQAYAVIVFSGALGLNMDGLFLDPFGFLKQTQLVGWGQCNNPFPNTKFKAEKTKYDKRKTLRSVFGSLSSAMPPKIEDFLAINPQDSMRNGFGNHMFCEYRISGSQIYDACAGPAVGDHDRVGYMLACIDTVTPETVPDFPKTETDIRNNAADPNKLTDYKRARTRNYIYDMEVKDVK